MDDFDIFDFFDFDDDQGGPFLRRAIRVLDKIFTRRIKDDEWVTRERKIVKIKRLKTSHLCNLLNFVRRNKAARKVGAARMQNLKVEALKRGLEQVDGFWKEPHSFDVVAS